MKATRKLRRRSFMRQIAGGAAAIRARAEQALTAWREQKVKTSFPTTCRSGYFLRLRQMRFGETGWSRSNSREAAPAAA
jgi:hypothetical protein